MDDLMFGDHQDESSTTEATQHQSRKVSSYLHLVLKRNALKTLEENPKRDPLDLPLTALKEPPTFSRIYTIGDLVYFIEKHKYLEKILKEQK